MPDEDVQIKFRVTKQELEKVGRIAQFRNISVPTLAKQRLLRVTGIAEDGLTDCLEINITPEERQALYRAAEKHDGTPSWRFAKEAALNAAIEVTGDPIVTITEVPDESPRPPEHGPLHPSIEAG